MKRILYTLAAAATLASAQDAETRGKKVVDDAIAALTCIRFWKRSKNVYWTMRALTTRARRLRL